MPVNINILLRIRKTIRERFEKDMATQEVQSRRKIDEKITLGITNNQTTHC